MPYLGREMESSQTQDQVEEESGLIIHPAEKEHRVKYLRLHFPMYLGRSKILGLRWLAPWAVVGLFLTPEWGDYRLLIQRILFCIIAN